ncbi:MAG TPA: hypothetical protein VMH88_00645 [Gemmatimonadales bacterium]|nr:hypothetical protein [Gemmatimonadales bacterium]
MRAVAISLGAVMSLGPVLLAGTAISADWKANTHRVESADVVTATPEQPLFYGGVLKPITVVGTRTGTIQAEAHQTSRCPSRPA